MEFLQNLFNSQVNDLLVDQLVPLVFSLLSLLAAWFIPKLLKMINQYLKDKLRLQQDLISIEHEKLLSMLAAKWIHRAEESARLHLKTVGKKVDGKEKLEDATKKLAEEAKIDPLTAQDLILAELNKSRATQSDSQ